MNNVHIKIKLAPGATMPTRATSGSVGYDVNCLRFYAVDFDDNKRQIESEDDLEEMADDKFQVDYVELHTGVHVQPEEGYRIDLCPCSRIAKTHVIYGNGIGHIDPDFTGGMRVILNTVDDGWYIRDLKKFLPGRVIGQLIILPKIDAVFEQVEELEATERGEGGFGSTAGKERKNG